MGYWAADHEIDYEVRRQQTFEREGEKKTRKPSHPRPAHLVPSRPPSSPASLQVTRLSLSPSRLPARVTVVLSIVLAPAATPLDEADGAIGTAIALEQHVVAVPARVARVVERLLDLGAVFAWVWC